ncbi:unnamed protein product [Ectocarpus sp. CCAP 1310/34]|nr:unnamed protein product [Ectocarpus sp. CCAP 1310/34]
METSLTRSKAAVSAVIVAALLTAWRVWQAGSRRRRRRSWRTTDNTARVLLLTASDNGKVLDLRDETSFGKAHIRGSHNIPVGSLWKENRWYELPEQHEPLVVLLPEEGAPWNALTSEALAEEITGRRAEGATATLVFDQEMLTTARESGLLLEEGEEGRESWSEKGGTAAVLASRPSQSAPSTLFTPSPFLTRAVAVIEPHLRHAWLPLTCIDIGCGAGRDAVWLAKRGWRVTAMDCWNQALQKAAQLARRNGVSERVEVLRGKVKHTGEIHVSVRAEEARDTAAAAAAAKEEAVDGGGGGGDGGGDGDGAAGGAGSEGGELIIRPSTPASEYGTYALVVAIRFLERSAFDTLVRLVDPRGGYVLLSTFIEEERETPRALGGAVGGSAGGGPRNGERSPSLPSNRGDREGLAFTDRRDGKAGCAAAAADDDEGVAAAVPTVSATPVVVTAAIGGRGARAGDPSAEAEERLLKSDLPLESCDAPAAGGRPVRPGAEGAGKEERTPVGKARKKNKPGSPAAALEAAAAAATLARWPHSSPRDYKKILRRGELARYFGDRHGFEVLEDSVERLPDGRPVACFLARRMPLVVSSPSNASSNANLWTPQRPPRQQLRRRGSWLAPSSPATPLSSSLGPRPAVSFRSLPGPQASNTAYKDGGGGGGGGGGEEKQHNDDEDDEDGDDYDYANYNANSSKRRSSNRGLSPADSFRIQHSSALLKDSERDDNDEEEDNGGDDGDDRVASDRSAMWGGYCGVGSGSRRDLTQTRAASIRRRSSRAAASGATPDKGEESGGV